jgi:23S rRNA (adenine-N6)-dimethyltransferase
VSRHHPSRSARQNTGRHETGQNFLVDRRVIARVVDAVAPLPGPIVEIGPGDGALTLPLARLGRSVTAVEIDPARADRLRDRSPALVTVVTSDVLRYRMPATPHVLVGNIPFHLTTAILRRILQNDGWTHAVLLVQWEVARRRAGVGGATLMTAAWWPWFEFELLGRVPSSAFRPVPGVDGGLLRITRRPRPLVGDRARYQRFVGDVFQGRGRGLPEILSRTRRVQRADLADWLRAEGITARHLPKHLDAAQWATLWRIAGGPPGTSGGR